MRCVHHIVRAVAAIACGSLLARLEGSAVAAESGAEQIEWRPYFDPGRWTTGDGGLRSSSSEENSARLAKLPPTADALIEARVRVGATGHRNFGFVFRARQGQTCQVVRYHDQPRQLEMLSYDQGQVKRHGGGGIRVTLAPGEWCRFKAAAVGGHILGKLWAATEPEPDWQLRKKAVDEQPGWVGLIAQDASEVAFDQIRVGSTAELDGLRNALRLEEQERRQRMVAELTLRVEPTPLIRRHPEGPRRQVHLRALVGSEPEPVGGTLSVSFGETRQALSLEPADYQQGSYPLLVPEPDEPVDLRVTLDTTLGKRLEAACNLQPARKWTVHVTHHTHFDIGYTDPQPVVLERLSKDMDTVVSYCEQTADWPPESRFRWTVENTALMKNYLARHTEAEAARLLEWVRNGSIEIGGFYLNMPTEMVGHEELIRCLYYAEELRRKHGIRIDTAVIHDVPGYGWALPGLLLEAGMPRLAVCANTIRGKFRWDQPGSVPRPFYWEGPDGRRVLVWYTHNYGDGHFLRGPGLHEREILGAIRANEAVNYPFDAIELGTGNDNQAPVLDVSRNIRAWNEKYLWPKLVLTTYGEFLTHMERAYGPRIKTFRGDIPSWWADGPGSAAKENGIVRLLHDKLVATEALWTLSWLTDPRSGYPREAINAAYDQMIHFDEHTWGARAAASHPRDENTLAQWAWKARYAHEAERRTSALHQTAIQKLSESIVPPGPNAIVVWNTLAWPRTDVVSLPLAGTGFEGKTAPAIRDHRNQRVLPAQISEDGQTASFVAPEVPALGFVVFTVESTTEALPRTAPATGTLENAFYRVVADPQAGGLKSIYDRRLDRELLDTAASYLGNQPIYEQSLDGRDAITSKKPSRFRRTAPTSGRLVRQASGPVHQDLVIDTSLPTMPCIRQQVRLYSALPVIDIANTVTKEEVFDPEGVYFAFPFAARLPDIRVQIADASMRPGKDQLPYSCHDYYAIQHWARVGGPGFEVVLAPLEAPIVTIAGLNAYQWADKINFNGGHIFSWVMNNYWYTNFPPGQSGTMSFRYRISSWAGKKDADATTRWAWQPFHPLSAVWLKPGPSGRPNPPESLLRIEGDPAIVSCVKLGEVDDVVIVRLLELRGLPSRCTLRLSLPEGCQLQRAFRANAVEKPQEPLHVSGNGAEVALMANQVLTVGLVLDRARR